MFHFIAWFMEKFGKCENEYGGYYTFKIWLLEISHEYYWFIDHTNFVFEFEWNGKKFYRKWIQGAVPPCEPNYKGKR